MTSFFDSPEKITLVAVIFICAIVIPHLHNLIQRQKAHLNALKNSNKTSPNAIIISQHEGETFSDDAKTLRSDAQHMLAGILANVYKIAASKNLDVRGSTNSRALDEISASIENLNMISPTYTQNNPVKEIHKEIYERIRCNSRRNI